MQAANKEDLLRAKTWWLKVSSTRHIVDRIAPSVERAINTLQARHLAAQADRLEASFMHLLTLVERLSDFKRHLADLSIELGPVSIVVNPRLR